MIKIAPVPPKHLKGLWPTLTPMLQRGFEAAYDVDPKMCISNLLKGKTRLWIVTDNVEITACFMTKTDSDSDGQVLTLFGLSGVKPWRWASDIDREVTAYAKHMGFARWRFWGKRAWKRFSPYVHFAIGKEIDGQTAFERAVI